ncbi:MAG: glycosyl hydrolase [Verrucomicrobia bacterium]|nr:glycosyl hydrolase [Verrucomicrobiota bacterium]
MNHSTKRISFIKTVNELVGVLLLATAAAWRPTPGIGAEATATNPTALPIQQKASDLLGGVQKAVCYSGFRTGQRPGQINPSEKQILEDLQILTRNGNFGLIRTYDAKVNTETVLRLIQNHKLNLKVLVGAWLNAEVINTNCPWLKTPHPKEVLEANKVENAHEVENAIRLAKRYPAIVVAVAVGNESLVSWNDHLVPVESVIAYVRHVKKSISQPVTVADNFDWWVHHGSALAQELDFVSVHTYAQWEGKDTAEAMPFTIANLQAVRHALPHSRLAITEAGWATVASEFGLRASEEKQQRYYHDLFTWTKSMNITTFFFEAFDEDWKGSPNDPLGAEKHWGLFTVDRKAKLAMHDLYPDLTPGKLLK